MGSAQADPWAVSYVAAAYAVLAEDTQDGLIRTGADGSENIAAVAMLGLEQVYSTGMHRF
jgi:hypothetical protein